MVLCTIAIQKMTKVKASPRFLKLAKKYMSDSVLQELVDTLCLFPEKGILVKGTGGIRKIRCRSGKNNKGKSGGLRILYYYKKDTLILLITLFNKSDKDNINESEKIELKIFLLNLLREI